MTIIQWLAFIINDCPQVVAGNWCFGIGWNPFESDEW
jgi:hypothetical protein